jgi:uncharacterized cupredoxin-like copper-binding protein
MKKLLLYAILTIMITSKGFIVFAQENKSVVVKNFNEITVSNGIDLVLIQGNSENLIITADAELLIM